MSLVVPVALIGSAGSLCYIFASEYYSQFIVALPGPQQLVNRFIASGYGTMVPCVLVGIVLGSISKSSLDISAKLIIAVDAFSTSHSTSKGKNTFPPKQIHMFL